jgi:hypothetical protein
VTRKTPSCLRATCGNVAPARTSRRKGVSRIAAPASDNIQSNHLCNSRGQPERSGPHLVAGEIPLHQRRQTPVDGCHHDVFPEQRKYPVPRARRRCTRFSSKRVAPQNHGSQPRCQREMAAPQRAGIGSLPGGLAHVDTNFYDRSAGRDGKLEDHGVVVPGPPQACSTQMPFWGREVPGKAALRQFPG